MSTLRKALEGIQLSPAAEKALTEAEEKQRSDAAYIEYLESQLKVSRGDHAQQASPYRKQWEQREARLEDVKERVLVCLSRVEQATSKQVALAVSAGVQTAQFHLEELEAADMVQSYGALESDQYWALDHKGRGYLVRHRLIN